MDELKKIKTKWHQDGEMEAFKTSIMAIASTRLGIKENEVINELENKFNMRTIESEDAVKIIRILSKSNTFDDAKEKIRKLN